MNIPLKQTAVDSAPAESQTCCHDYTSPFPQSAGHTAFRFLVFDLCVAQSLVLPLALEVELDHLPG